MKYNIRHILNVLMAAVVMLAVGGCRDDFNYNGNPLDITGETARVSLTADFMPVAEGNLRSRSDGSVANDGDCMTDFKDLCLVIFDRNGKYYGYHNIDKNNITIDWENRTDADASNGNIAGENSTRKLKFDLELPTGTYYLYALSNMGSVDKDGNETTTAYYIESLGLQQGVTTREWFESQRKPWDTSIMANNSGMTGFFTNGKQGSPSTLTPADKESVGQPDRETEGTEVTTVSVTRNGTELHCWLRRMASKLTIDIDASGLKSDVYVYVRDIRVYNIASSCNIMGPNEPSEDGDVIVHGDDPQILMYCNREDAGQNDLSDIHAHYEKWPCLTAFDKNLGSLVAKFPHLNRYNHSNSAPSLFFYENMQGKGVSKLQDADGDGKVDSPYSNETDDPDFRDRKYYGTYIEVSAYYVSRNEGRLGNGPIKYRFMLGKNISTDYNTERNFHYKLTLRLLGYANEVDWHIDYSTDTEDISLPNPYYISYSSGERLDFPIVVYGKLTKATATIVRNDWEPSVPWEDTKPVGQDVYYDQPIDEFYTGVDEGTGQNKANALGFLTLLKPDYDAIGTHFGAEKAFNNDYVHQYLWRYWIGNGDVTAGTPIGSQDERRNPQYTRDYNVSASKTYELDGIGEDGSYTVQHNTVPEPGMKYGSTYLEISLYTRERNLIKTTGLSGANPYEGYQRRAKVKFHLEYTRGDVKFEKDTTITIIQVERLVNPTGVWRKWDNARPFYVRLSQLNGSSAISFHTLISRGSWSAEVEVGSEWILLNGKRSVVKGETGSTVEFEIKPTGLLSDAGQVRCGIIKVRYHNNTCVHRIFVRQGYAPIAVNEGGPKWHSYNLVSKDKEADSPLDEGSMFKFDNLGQPIAASNNVNDRYPWVNVKPEHFKDHRYDLLEIVDDKPTAWDDIKLEKYPVGDNEFDQSELTVSGRMMTANDVALLRDNIHNRIRYGVCYADGATNTEVHIDQVYGYRGLDSHGNYGMRGCFVFNQATGAQVFFPIGASGYGVRRFVRSTDDWVNFKEYVKLKYAGSDKNFSIPKKSPMFYHLFRSPGAMYWAARSVGQTLWGITGLEEVDKDAGGMDINYFSYDFNNAPAVENFYENSMKYGTIACFIRLLDGPEIQYNKSLNTKE